MNAYRLMLTLILGIFPSTGFSLSGEWPFKVYLDDQLVGSHRFSIKGEDARRELISVAEFDVRFLGIGFYHYAHASREVWKQNCLTEIHAETNDNGTRIKVEGQPQPEGFMVNVDGSPATFPACIMTFAYWNPEMLKQTRLLNPQTGDFTDVNIRKVGVDIIKISGQDQSVDHYHLSSSKFSIDLWYDRNGRWVALDSSVENNRKLRYRLD